MSPNVQCSQNENKLLSQNLERKNCHVISDCNDRYKNNPFISSPFIKRRKTNVEGGRDDSVVELGAD